MLTLAPFGLAAQYRRHLSPNACYLPGLSMVTEECNRGWHRSSDFVTTSFQVRTTNDWWKRLVPAVKAGAWHDELSGVFMLNADPATDI